VALQVDQRQRAAQRLQIGGHAAGQIAPVEIVDAGPRQLFQRGRKAWLPEDRPRGRRLTVHQERLGKAGHADQLVAFGGGAARLAGRHRHAIARIVDRIGQ
jgi:hypothetical protein